MFGVPAVIGFHRISTMWNLISARYYVVTASKITGNLLRQPAWEHVSSYYGKGKEKNC